MNYKQIVVNGHNESKTQEKLLSYFKREAKLANIDNSVEFKDFFDGCKYVISQYKKDVEDQFKNDLNEGNLNLYLYTQMLNNGETLDANGNSIQESIKRIEEDREFIMNEGYEDNIQYRCCVRSDTCEIVENNMTGCLIPLHEDSRKPKYGIFKLTYLDIENIEKSIFKSENDMFKEPDNKSNMLDYQNKINFSSYLHHPNKDLLINKLHEILDDAKGKTVAITIMALAELSFLAGYKSKRILYDSMRKEFGDIGKDSGLNIFQNENNKKLNESDIKKVIEILKRVNT